MRPFRLVGQSGRPFLFEGYSEELVGPGGNGHGCVSFQFEAEVVACSADAGADGFFSQFELDECGLVSMDVLADIMSAFFKFPLGHVRLVLC